MTDITRDEFVTGAKAVILGHIKTLFEDPNKVGPEDVRIMWAMRYGRHDWKGMLTTTIPDAKVYMVDYSAKLEIYYVYCYTKVHKFQIDAQGIRRGDEKEDKGAEDC